MFFGETNATRQGTVDVAAAVEGVELASSMFYICIRWRVTIGWARGGGGGDVLQDLLERPFVLVSASGGAVKYKLDLRER